MTKDEITKIATRSGFVDVFWKRLQGNRRIGKMDTRQQIYTKMEEEYEAKYGAGCFPSWEAFRKYLNRHP